MSDGCSIGIDIGGGTCRAACVDARGAIQRLETAPTPADGAPDALRSVLRELAARLPAADVPAGSTAGVAMPGIRDASGRVLRRSVHLPALQGCNVGELFAAALERPVILETDVNAAGWAQWLALHSPDRFLYLSLGTGIGGAVILHRELLRHTAGCAGHFGFLLGSLEADAPVGKAGIRGCLEAMASGPALDAGVSLDDAADAIASALANVAFLYRPDVVALGGGVVEHHADLVARIERRLRVRLPDAATSIVPRPSVHSAPLASDHAGVIGAAMLARIP